MRNRVGSVGDIENLALLELLPPTTSTVQEVLVPYIHQVHTDRQTHTRRHTNTVCMFMYVPKKIMIGFSKIHDTSMHPTTKN